MQSNTVATFLYFTTRLGNWQLIGNTTEDAMSTQSLEVPLVSRANEPCELLIILPIFNWFKRRADKAIGNWQYREDAMVCQHNMFQAVV